VRIIASLCFFFTLACCIGQDSTTKGKLTWEVFFDVYYSYDFNKPPNHQKPAVLYNHNRHNEFNLNLGLARVMYNSGKVRAAAGLMAGTYAESNLSNEPELLRQVYEASIGVKIAEKSNLWIDAGIFPSHIGFEGAVSKDCWTLTRSILAENSPYYEAGIKSTYTSKNNKWLFSVLLINGWQRIKRPEGNNTIAVGTQITYRKSKQFMVNYSSFIGNDKPDSARRYRYFHNFYSIIELSGRWGLTLGFDIGMEQATKSAPQMNYWYSPVLILRYTASEAWSIAARTEYYNDKNAVIIPAINTNKFQAAGISLNIDHAIGQNLLWRIEGRALRNKEPYFKKSQTLSRSSIFITTSMAIKF
jgi:hypothetical protein